MDNKILLQDLAQGLAKRKKMTRRDAEAFIHKVFEVIQERVIADGMVKVKGLGTFKMNTVDSRESVNVATGERFVIDTHARISFTPHPTLRDAVNRPFSDFETVVISDDVMTEDMEYIPPAETPAEETSVPAVEAVEPKDEDEPSVDAAPLVAEEPTLAEEASEPAPEPEPAEEPAAKEPAPAAEPEPVTVEPKPTVPKVQNEGNRGLASEASQPTDGVTPQISAGGTEHSNAQTSQTTSSRKKGFIIAVVLCLVVLCVLFFVFWHPSAPTEDTVEITETIVAQDDATSEQSTATEAQPATPVEETLTPEEAAEKYPQVEGGEYLIVGTKEEYTLQKGDDLHKLSVGVYGDKKFATYIIVYNDIKNPSLLLIGDVLKLPELRKKE